MSDQLVTCEPMQLAGTIVQNIRIQLVDHVITMLHELKSALQ